MRNGTEKSVTKNEYTPLPTAPTPPPRMNGVIKNAKGIDFDYGPIIVPPGYYLVCFNMS
jgi:hypothetical protein